MDDVMVIATYGIEMRSKRKHRRLPHLSSIFSFLSVCLIFAISKHQNNAVPSQPRGLLYFPIRRKRRLSQVAPARLLPIPRREAVHSRLERSQRAEGCVAREVRSGGCAGGKSKGNVVVAQPYEVTIKYRARQRGNRLSRWRRLWSGRTKKR